MILFTVVRRIDFLAAYQQLLIVGYGQCTATIQAQDALRARWQHQAGQVDETEELFSLYLYIVNVVEILFYEATIIA